MKFTVHSRHNAERVDPLNVPHLVVSITTPGDPNPVAAIKTNEHTLEVVRLSFADWDTTRQTDVSASDDRLFSVAQAKKILDAVKLHAAAEHIIVHCDAGWSRSPAVAAALSKILEGDDACFFRQYTPNMRVYRTILETYYNGD